MHDKDRFRLAISSQGTVPNDATHDVQPNGIYRLGLKKHQLQSIRAMDALESATSSIMDGETIVAEIGILSNKIGSGKSLCVLGLIAFRVRLASQSMVTYHFGDAAYVMHPIVITGGNLIVVPNHLVHMWAAYIVRYTTLTSMIIKKDMFPLDWENIATYDIVLCGASYYNMLIKSCPWTWSRVVFDEADSINIPACVKPSARFVWFVSSSLNNLLFCDGHFWKYETEGRLTRMTTNGIARSGYIKTTFKRLESVHADRILPRLIVKMNDEYIDDQLKLPPIWHHNVVCEDPVELLVLENAVSDHVRMILNGHDPQSAMDYLGCPVGSKDNIISYVCKNLSVKIKNFEKKIEYLDNIESMDSESLETLQAKRIKTHSKITELQQKLQRIHDQIDAFSKTEPPVLTCPVCLEEDHDMCMFTCCMNQFCTTCVEKLYVKQRHAVCPLCRGEFQTMVLRKHTQTPRIGTKYTETTRLLKERLACEDTSLIVFMWTDNTLRKLQRVLENKGIVHRTLSGNGHAIQKTIRWFDEKRVRLLLVNASLYGCGLDLSSATDVVLFQRMHMDHENQLTGRAHRIGRTHELHVHRILHRNEV